MSKRHNRKRTRSRPRHRDGSRAHSNHNRTMSIGTNSSSGTIHAPFPMSHVHHYSIATASPDHWHQTYATWQNRLQLERELEQQRVMEAYRLRIFGGEAGDEASLMEPMLKVVTDLFDGNTDYEDP